ncbi:class I SAM-dependent methyltransferase [Paenactinomyces guangxiensis]|uniref:Class I SAM-dependent methyltransferase n=1 Tax=Paenactinomyces guangxiensis TaxID=1490290 RepID=A0A7W2A8E9_9BACL|nr:class I SAM-dependent methyltransferase [Paenactinomyces guangxiensis]MBA4494570.1 class I SAM-dependent methyltransferase [Paenactinomyces guangxiensis]MBH8591667.1 class I SAM-dependent methyltransferase [Paenactinomyces guangxiensis]
MELSPGLYHGFVRPRWLTKIYIHDMIQRHFDLTGKAVLDFGSGTGSCSCICTPKHYLGIDPDPKRVAYARRLYPDYNFAVLEGSSLPASDKSFDYILIVAVLHHIPPDTLPAYLQEFHRVLKPTGKILVMEPCFLKNSLFNNRFMAFFDRGKYIRYESGYRSIFTKHHYRIEKLKEFKKMLFYNELFFMAIPE